MKTYPTLILLLLSTLDVYCQESCDSKIYCQGDLLETVQLKYHSLFKDTKEFVDMWQHNDPDVTLKDFQTLMSVTNNNPTDAQMKDYLDKHFKLEGELDEWTPDDYNENPTFLTKIVDKKLKQFALDLVKFWPKLGRTVKDSVRTHPERHSLIALPNGFIVPGGRFREIYYWDSYWIIDGLLISEMPKTVQRMLENFIFLIKQYGFIPNGNRVYYLNRSQPPLFTLMVSRYIEETKNLTWLSQNVKYIEAELNWWLVNRTIEVEKNGTKYTLARYAVPSGTPRPESYYEDVDTCGRLKTKEVSDCYKNLKSGAETGWDFSSRWFSKSMFRSTLHYIDTYHVIPVDLNAYLCRSFKELAKFYESLGNKAQATLWFERSGTWQKSIEAVFYDREEGIWFDFDLNLSQPRKMFFPSNFAPLWTNSYNLEYKNTYGAKAAEYLKSKIDLGYYKSGIPTSVNQTGEQWDYPNAWPPLQDIVIKGLHNTGNDEAMKIAQKIASNWIRSNYIGFDKENSMYEKYDAVEPGKYGGGGEYEIQIGFGWSNGVIISLLNMYPTVSSGVPVKTWSNYLIIVLVIFCMTTFGIMQS